MVVKFHKTNYDTVNEEGFYLLSLNNNNYSDAFIKYPGSNYIHINEFHLRNVKTNLVTNKSILSLLKEDIHDYEFEKDNTYLDKLRRQNSLPIIGEYRNNEMRDIITGKIINDKPPGLSYKHCIKISPAIVREVLASINTEDVKKYADVILKIEEESITKEKSI